MIAYRYLHVKQQRLEFPQPEVAAEMSVQNEKGVLPKGMLWMRFKIILSDSLTMAL